jgi:CubicO group peptidase (beta-lactamase class C family)
VRTSLKVIRIITVGLIGFYVILFGVTRVIHYPEPIAAIKLGLAPASKTPTMMPFHTITPAKNPLPWVTGDEAMPAEVNWDGKNIPFNDFLTITNSNAFLVIRDGVITYEWYKDGITSHTQLPSYSVAKTMTSLMIGQLVAQGKIEESDTFVKYFPEYATGDSFDDVTIKSLLDMQAGVGVSDNYPTGPSGWGVGIAQMYATTDLKFFMQHNRKMSWAPGTQSEYRSVDTQMLGFIIQKVTGMKVADYFSQNIWQPIGAQDSAFWNVDHVGGLEKTFCCFNATARDYARVGSLVLNNGVSALGTKNLIDANWMARLSNPVTTLDHGWGYSAQLWHPFTGTMMMLGLHGQYIVIQPSTHTVMVKLSDEPTDSGNFEELTAAVMHEIALNKN